MLSLIQAVAEAPLPCLPPCDEVHFAKCLRAMQAVLPRQQADDVGGELLFRTYRRQLGHYPAAALSYLTEQATARFQWFPTIAQCLDILKLWRRADKAAGDQMLARAAVRNELQARMEDAFRAMKDASITLFEIEALPESWRRIGVERGLLRRNEDGTYYLRRTAAAGDQEAKAA